VEVEVKIRGLMMDPVTNMPIIVLKETCGEAVLPIWVGVFEANAIAVEIEKSQLLRPLTHDLLCNVFGGLGTRIQKVVVSELKEETFYAVIWAEREGEMVAFDARPSDALALALRADCPIYVENDVLQRGKLTPGNADSTPEELRRWLDNLNDEDLGKYKM
jgi:hypothetical protein